MPGFKHFRSRHTRLFDRAAALAVEGTDIHAKDIAVEYRPSEERIVFHFSPAASAVYYEDIRAINTRLFTACRANTLLTPGAEGNVMITLYRPGEEAEPGQKNSRSRNSAICFPERKESGNRSAFLQEMIP